MFDNIRALQRIKTTITAIWSVGAVALLYFIGYATEQVQWEPTAKLLALIYLISCLAMLSLESRLNKRIKELKKSLRDGE